MKNKPIEKPQFTGCVNCSPRLTTVVNKNHFCDVGFGTAELVIDIKRFDISDKGMTLGGIELRYCSLLKDCKCAEIILYGPLHGETFELNTEDRNWYLTAQNEGFV